jgi:hypothetical protein
LAFFLGTIFPSSWLNNSKEGTGILGGFLGFLLSIIIFPETIRELFKEQSESRTERLLEERKLGFYRSLTHPTQIPFTASMVLFILMVIVIVFLDLLNINMTPLQKG